MHRAKACHFGGTQWSARSLYTHILIVPDPKIVSLQFQIRAIAKVLNIGV